MSVSYTHLEQAEAVPFIMDCLDPVRPFPAEKEQGIAVRVKLKAVLDDIHQTVQLFSHILSLIHI